VLCSNWRWRSLGYEKCQGTRMVVHCSLYASWMTGIWFPARALIDQSLRHHVPNVCGAHTPSYQMGPAGTELKWPQFQAQHYSTLSSTEAETAWSFTYTTPCVFKRTRSFTFQFTFLHTQVSSLSPFKHGKSLIQRYSTALCYVSLSDW